MKLSVVIPVFNESATLAELLRRVVAVDLPKEIVLVDDASTDGSGDFLRDLAARGVEAIEGAQPRGLTEIRAVFQSENRGKGAALRRGFAEAKGDLVVVQDADLEYDPNDYPALVAPILAGEADVVYGSRFLHAPRRVNAFWHTRMNRMLTSCSNALTNLDLTDMETCYKLFRAEDIKAVEIEEDRFGFEPEITAKLARRGLRFYEVPIHYSPRNYAEGKKIGWKDGVRALYAIVKYGAKARV